MTSQGRSWAAATQIITIKALITNNQSGSFQTISGAIAGTTSGGTITIPAGIYDLTSELDITNPVTIVGQGSVTLLANNVAWDTTNNGKHIIGIYGGTASSSISLSNLIIDCNSQCYGLNTYNNAYGILNDVTVKDSKGAALTVNGSTIVATNLNTSNNAWGAVNVDPGLGVTTPSVFTLNSGTLAESKQIWSDGRNVTDTATVTVNAPGYRIYKVAGTPSALFWASKPLTTGVSLIGEDTSTVYSTIQAAIDAASDDDAVVLNADTTTTTQINVNKAITIDGNGHTLSPTFAKTDNSNNSAIGITHPDVTIKNLIEDGTAGTNLHGINIYESTGVNLDGVTVSNNGHSGVNVDGSIVIVNNITTSNNGWDGIDVDQGPSVMTATASFPATLTVNGISSHSEAQAPIQQDDNTKTYVSVIDANNQYNSSTYTHDTNVVGTKWALKNTVVNTEAELQTTLDNPLVGTITARAGTYTGNIAINRSLTLKGAQAGVDATKAARSAVRLASGPDFSNESVIAGTVTISAPSVTLDGFTVDTGTNAFGVNLTGTYADYHVLNNVIRDNSYGVLLNGTDTSAASTILKNAFINNNKGTEGHGVSAQGLTKNLTISGNYFAGNYNGSNNSESVNFYGLPDGHHSTISVSDNTLNDSSLVFGSMDGLTVTDNSVHMADMADNAALFIAGDVQGATITDNTLYGTHRSVYIAPNFFSIATASAGIVIRKNQLLGADTGIEIADGRYTGTLDATLNWWGNVSGPTISTNPNGTGSAIVGTSPVIFNPWYINSGRTVLNTDIEGDVINVPSGNMDFREEGPGAVGMPSGTSELHLGNDSQLDFSADTSDTAGWDGPGKAINFWNGAGSTQIPLNNGIVNGVDLNSAQNVGGQDVLVGKGLKLSSGSNSPVTLTNNSISNASLSIPSGTIILGPSEWDGKMQPPKAGSPSGVAPSGFSVGGSVIEVGSPGVVLLFDSPVTLTLTGVTGAVAYKPANSSTWTTITNVCSGDYSNPTGAVFPGECKITNGTDTKIVTFHFTSFAPLSPIPSSGGNSAGGLYGNPVYNPNPATATPPAPEVLGATITLGDPANLIKNKLKEGNLVSANSYGDLDVYTVNISGYKRLLLNPTIFDLYGGSWSDVKSITPEVRDSFPTSGLFRNCEANDPKVYALEVTGEDTGVLHWVNTTGAQALAQDSQFFKKVFCVNSAEFNWYSKF